MQCRSLARLGPSLTSLAGRSTLAADVPCLKQLQALQLYKAVTVYVAQVPLAVLSFLTLDSGHLGQLSCRLHHLKETHVTGCQGWRPFQHLHRIALGSNGRGHRLDLLLPTLPLQRQLKHFCLLAVKPGEFAGKFASPCMPGTCCCISLCTGKMDEPTVGLSLPPCLILAAAKVLMC